MLNGGGAEKWTYAGQQNAAVSPCSNLPITSRAVNLSAVSALTTVAVVHPAGHTNPGEYIANSSHVCFPGKHVLWPLWQPV